MGAFENLAEAAGAWRGTNVLQDPHAGKPDASASDATVTPILGGRFVRLDYTWSYGGAPQEGSILLGHDPKAGASSGYWIDTFHNGRKAMLCTGAAANGDGDSWSVRGSYAAPPGPDWGWRILLTPPSDGDPVLTITMFNIWPESEGGQEDLAVEARYTRA